MLERLLNEKQMSVFQCAKLSGIPYTALLEIARGKTNIGKCSTETVYRLVSVLNVALEDILSLCLNILAVLMIFLFAKSTIKSQYSP